MGELDQQRGQPDPDDDHCITANLVEELLEPELEENVAIGPQVEAVFQEEGERYYLPQFRLSGEPP